MTSGEVTPNAYDHFYVVSAPAGVWCCKWCGTHTASPVEHNKECPSNGVTESAAPSTGE